MSTSRTIIVVRLALVCWVAGYGTLRVLWAAGHRPWIPPLGDDLLSLSDWGVVALAGAAGLVAVVTAPRWTPRPVRWGGVVVGSGVALTLVAASVLLLLDVVALVFPGIGVPSSWLGLASRLGCLAGGLLTAYVTRAALRDLRGACPRCGRTEPAGAVGARWWAPVGAVLAVVGCATRFLAQGLVGFSSGPDGFAGLPGLAFLVTLAAAGTLLPAALVHPWGRRLPRWLVLAPAVFVAAGLTTYFGIGTAQLVVEGAGPSAAETGLPTWFFWVAAPAYLLWGLGLAAATVGYWRRTRPACPRCAPPDDVATSGGGVCSSVRWTSRAGRP